MHFIKRPLFILIMAGLAACQQADKDQPPVTVKKVESREDSLYRKTMDIHNEVMAKMPKLIGYQKKVQQQSDSIQNILATTDFPRQMAQRISRELDSLQMLGKRLGAADSGMNAWMEQFNPDPKMASSDANADYFEKQKGSAEAMKQKFFEALQKAEQFYSRQK